MHHSEKTPSRGGFASRAIGLGFMLAACVPLAAQTARLLNEPLDISGDFQDFTNVYFLADSLDGFDPATGAGKVKYQRNMRTTAHAFDNTLPAVKASPGNEFPEIEYAADPSLPFSVEFATPRTVRIRMATGPAGKEAESLMLAGPVPKDNSWKYARTAAGHRYTSTAATSAELARAS